MYTQLKRKTNYSEGFPCLKRCFHSSLSSTTITDLIGWSQLDALHHLSSIFKLPTFAVSKYNLSEKQNIWWVRLAVTMVTGFDLLSCHDVSGRDSCTSGWNVTTPDSYCSCTTGRVSEVFDQLLLILDLIYLLNISMFALSPCSTLTKAFSLKSDCVQPHRAARCCRLVLLNVLSMHFYAWCEVLWIMWVSEKSFTNSLRASAGGGGRERRLWEAQGKDGCQKGREGETSSKQMNDPAFLITFLHMVCTCVCVCVCVQLCLPNSPCKSVSSSQSSRTLFLLSFSQGWSCCIHSALNCFCASC